jgi:predicted RNase H-like nuclease (RuvC/YqgF family)
MIDFQTAFNVIGGGALLAWFIKFVIERAFTKKDKKDDATAARKDKEGAVAIENEGKAMDAEAQFRADLIKRVETLEQDLKEMQKEQLSQARRDATLTAQNEHLDKENTRQAGEITDLKARNRQLNDKVTDLTNTVGILARKISELTGQPIDVRLVDDKGENT